jgi:type VI secretion system protein ImpM
MPDDVLTPDPSTDDLRPVVGFFGKMPTLGDFVWRGLPDTFRTKWDAWLTRHIAPLERAGGVCPKGGLRFSLPSGRRFAAGVIVFSHDSVGRHFPLTLLLVADGRLTREQIDPWCDAALALDPGTLSPDALWSSLDALPSPTPGAPAAGPMHLWLPGGPCIATDPTDPGNVLRTLFQV